jgi:hypothetical protein
MTELKYSKEKPKIYDKLHEQFGVEWNDGVVIANDWTIHCAYEVSPEKVVHELCHLKRQSEIGNDLWWEMFCSDRNFRFQEESKAYYEEAKFIKENIKDRNFAFKMLWELCEHLSGNTYGSMCSFDDAKKLLL